jgi:hypothetical protein
MFYSEKFRRDKAGGLNLFRYNNILSLPDGSKDEKMSTLNFQMDFMIFLCFEPFFVVAISRV